MSACILVGFCTLALGSMGASLADPVTPTPQIPAASAGAAAAQEVKKPQGFYPVKTQTVDNVEGGGVAHFSFQLMNKGNVNLTINAVQPSCGCTIPSFESTIAPGKTGIIAADVHTQPLWGSVVKTLSVYTNDPATPMDILFLVVKVTPAYTIEPGENQSTPYDVPAPITRTYRIKTSRKAPFTLGTPTETGPVKTTIAPDPTDKGSWIATVTLDPPSSGGDVMGQVDIPTSIIQLPNIHLTLVALGQKGISTSPPALSFGRIEAGATAAHSTIGVYSRAGKFHILKVEADDPALSTQFKAQPTSIIWYDLQVTYGGGWKVGRHEGYLTVTTDSAIAPVVKVPYKADVE